MPSPSRTFVRLGDGTVEVEIDFITNDVGYTAYLCKPRLLTIGKYEEILNQELEFTTRTCKDAANKCTQRIIQICLVLSVPTVESIPGAVRHAWLEPEHGE